LECSNQASFGDTAMKRAIAARIMGHHGSVFSLSFVERRKADVEILARYGLDAKEGYRQYYDWERLLRDVLEPLRRGDSARYQVYDWEGNRLGVWLYASAAQIVIVEGCYSSRPEFGAIIDFTVLVEADPRMRAKRQAKRGDASTAWLARWDAAERHYLSATRLRKRADAIVAGQ
jgi:phosphoribulokinase